MAASAKNSLASFIRRESNEISRFWLYPRMQIEKSERSKRDIIASRENGMAWCIWLIFCMKHEWDLAFENYQIEKNWLQN